MDKKLRTLLVSEEFELLIREMKAQVMSVKNQPFDGSMEEVYGEAMRRQGMGDAILLLREMESQALKDNDNSKFQKR